MNSLLARLGTLIAELRRRHVFRVAVVYAVVAWAVIQVAATTFPILELPSWTTRLVLALVLLGFPPALVLAWAFEVTPDGVRRTPGAARAEPAPPRARSRGRRLAGAVALTAVAGIGGFAAVRGASGGGARAEPSLAVLPFVNGSAERENEYFSDGITDDLTTRLSRIDGLTVISHTAAMRYKGTDKPLPQVARELGVASLLTGRVQRVGSRVRISAELVDPRSGRELWRESYDRELNDIFALQGDLAQEIARALELRLSSGVRGRLARRETSSTQAYDAVLRAREMLNRRSLTNAEDGRKALSAIGLLRQALEHDPEYAAAYALLATIYASEPPPDLSPAQRRDSAEKYVRLALQADPEEPAAVAERGWLYFDDRRDEEAREQFEYALRLNPSSPDGLAGMVDYHARPGRLDEALRYQKRLTAIQPTAGAYLALGYRYGVLGDYAQAERWIRRSLEIDPDPMVLHCHLAEIAAVLRRDGQAAREHLRAMLALDSASAWPLGCASNVEVYLGEFAAARAHLERFAALEVPVFLRQGYATLKTGDTVRADSLLRRAEEQTRNVLRDAPNDITLHMGLALILSLRGRNDEALRSVRNAIARGWRGYYRFRYAGTSWETVEGSPYMERLRADPRFMQMMAGVKADVDRQRERVRRDGI